MDHKERFIETLLFGTPDKIPFEPGQPREKTLKRWYEEGLPKNRHWFEYLSEKIGIEDSRYDYDLLQPDINLKMNPMCEEKVLEHRNGHYVVQDWMGNVVEISDEYDYTYIH